MRLPQIFTKSRRTAGEESPAPSPSVAVDPQTLRHEAEHLVGQGDLTGAVDKFVVANRCQRDPLAEMRLRDLRHDAAAAFDAGPGRADWPPVYADPFPGLSGRPPEIAASELDTATLGGAVAHHGCLVVRGAFDAEQVERSVDAIDRAQAVWEAMPDGGGEGDEWYSPLHLAPKTKNQILRNMVARQGGIWLGDSPATTEQVLGDLDRAGVVPAITGHFGERPFFSLQKSTLRRSAPVYNLAAWHQDGSFLSDGVRTMNAWVALTRCGGDRPTPGLEMVPRREPQVWPVDGVMSPHSISYDLVAEIASDMPTVIPEFEPGDAILFDEVLVHRTHLTENMTEPRYAIECWFFAPSHYSTTYAPLLV